MKKIYRSFPLVTPWQPLSCPSDIPRMPDGSLVEKFYCSNGEDWGNYPEAGRREDVF